MPKKPERRPPITLKTLLNNVHPIKRFVYARIFIEGQGANKRLLAQVVPRANSRPRGSGGGQPGPGYDRLPGPRRFEFIPLFNLPRFLSYPMRRVACPDGGGRVEQVPWAEGKHAGGNVFRHFLATWARRLSWKETAAGFRTAWDTVRRSVEWLVAWGLERRRLEDVSALGIDEVAYRLGHPS